MAAEGEAAPAPIVFNLDSWKRTYSNEEVSVSIPWFFDNFDAKEYCVYFSKYKFELSQPMQFMVSNLVGGMFQRLERFNKIAFGSVLIFGNEKPFQIEGVWVFKGTEMPKELNDCDDVELYDWKKLDLVADKALITEYLAWEGDFGGRKDFDGKVFK
uniref:Eukaryotic translation elongation factor 1 gamma, putative n=1 Tax=Entamoeba histolytica TaxID=5759 RepID=S0AUS4_ENTHI|nr:eukaryotic translation elongation factor 1 gamma, putative [Entamoeba histolytica]